VAALLSALSAATLTAWASQMAAAVPVFVVVAALAWRFTPIDTGSLGWDGAQWRFRDLPGSLLPAIDLGGWMLLRFDPAGAGRRAWLATSEGAAGAAWHPLRAAVYCRRSNRDDSDSENTSAPRA